MGEEVDAAVRAQRLLRCGDCWRGLLDRKLLLLLLLLLLRLLGLRRCGRSARGAWRRLLRTASGRRLLDVLRRGPRCRRLGAGRCTCTCTAQQETEEALSSTNDQACQTQGCTWQGLVQSGMLRSRGRQVFFSAVRLRARN